MLHTPPYNTGQTCPPSYTQRHTHIHTHTHRHVSTATTRTIDAYARTRREVAAM